MRRWTKPFFAVLLLTATSLPAHAGFDEDVAKAYAPYRAALFKSNQKDADATKAAISKFLKLWNGKVLTNYPEAPARYASEPEWSKTLNDIKAIALKAQAVAEEGNIAEAHEILEAVRDELDALRDRNGIRVFSSFINAYHTEMEHLFGINVTAETWTPELAGEIREQTGILKYLSSVIISHAPA